MAENKYKNCKTCIHYHYGGANIGSYCKQKLNKLTLRQRAKLTRDSLPKCLPYSVCNKYEPTLSFTKLLNGQTRKRLIGSFVGLTIGDAFGTTLEFAERDEFPEITQIVGGGPFNLKPGQWTDDTSMALCLAESLYEYDEFNPIDQLERYSKWYRFGYNSPTGTCFDIGNTTRNAIERFEETNESYCGSEDSQTAGNGSIMRLAPIAIKYWQNTNDLIKYAALSSKTTHAAKEAVQASVVLALFLQGIFQAKHKDELFSTEFAEFIISKIDDISPKLKAILLGSYKTKGRNEISSSGYVIHTLEAALWSFYNGKTFSETIIFAVNLAEDADTVGAVTGQIAGAYYSYGKTVKKWSKNIYKIEDIVKLINKLI